jgi:hypothetical protein
MNRQMKSHCYVVLLVVLAHIGNVNSVDDEIRKNGARGGINNHAPVRSLYKRKSVARHFMSSLILLLVFLVLSIAGTR